MAPFRLANKKQETTFFAAPFSLVALLKEFFFCSWSLVFWKAWDMCQLS